MSYMINRDQSFLIPLFPPTANDTLTLHIHCCMFILTYYLCLELSNHSSLSSTLSLSRFFQSFSLIAQLLFIFFIKYACLHIRQKDFQFPQISTHQCYLHLSNLNQSHRIYNTNILQSNGSPQNHANIKLFLSILSRRVYLLCFEWVVGSIKWILLQYLQQLRVDMSKPQSIKVDPWTDFPRLAYTFVNDDFVHDKLFVAKANAKGAKSTVNLKASVSQDKGGLATSDEAKIWFELPQGRALFAKIKSSNYLKLQLDNGVAEQWGRKWNLYAGINATKSLENISIRLGAAHLHSVCHSDNRVKIDHNADGRNNLTWYNRTVATQDKFTFGVLGAYGISSNVLVKNNLLVGYKLDDNTNAFLRLENNGFRKGGFNWADASGYFDHVKLDVVSSFRGWKWGVETILNTKGKLFSEAIAAFEHTFPEQNLTVKARVSSNAYATLLLRFPSLLFKDIAKTSVGVQANDILGAKQSFKYGAQIEFNV